MHRTVYAATHGNITAGQQGIENTQTDINNEVALKIQADMQDEAIQCRSTNHMHFPSIRLLEAF